MSLFCALTAVFPSIYLITLLSLSFSFWNFHYTQQGHLKHSQFAHHHLSHQHTISQKIPFPSTLPSSLLLPPPPSASSSQSALLILSPPPPLSSPPSLLPPSATLPLPSLSPSPFRKSASCNYHCEYSSISFQTALMIFITLLCNIILSFQSTKMIFDFGIFSIFILFILIYAKFYTNFSLNLT